MIKTLPKIIISVAALFGMFINLHLIHTLSDHSAVSGVEELLSLRMYVFDSWRCDCRICSV